MKVQEWGADFLENVLAQAGAREDGEFQENVFTEEAVAYLVDAGECIDPELAYFRGRGVKLNAWDLHEESDSVDLFVSLFDGTEACRKVPRSEAADALARGRRFLERAIEGLWKELEESSEAFAAAQGLHAARADLARAKVYVLSNGLIGPEPFPDTTIGRVEVSHYVCDLDKLFQASGAGAVREPIEIGPDDLGGGLTCTKLPRDNGVYDSYIGVLPGKVLASLYQRWGQRILERNVRSYLQARAAVNKGILETVREQPEMFLAYNNGISTVAESAEVAPGGGELVLIRHLRNFQVVNGAQTTATLHDAQRNRGIDLSAVYVPFKLTVLRDSAKVNELVPSISRYANTQNRVSLSDFSANDPYHIELERLSRTTWVPSERGKSTTKWFYERARGAYINEMNREGSEAKKRAFKATYPKSQLLNKTSVAKYWMTWAQQPNVVSLGAEKNFSRFMEAVTKSSHHVPDEAYFKRLVAKAILFRECDRLVAQQDMGGYKANVVTYTVAWLSHITAQRIDLERVWERQAPSDAVLEAMLDLSKNVWGHISRPPPNVKNLSEWAKREACWATLRDKSHALPRLESELVEVSPGEASALERVPVSTPISPEAESEITAVVSKDANWWFGLARWAARTDNLQGWERSLAVSLGRLASTGRRPSVRQAHQGARILTEATERGYRPLPATAGDSPDGSGNAGPFRVGRNGHAKRAGSKSEGVEGSSP